jgi:hypothetical protein
VTIGCVSGAIGCAWGTFGYIGSFSTITGFFGVIGNVGEF